MLVLSRMQGQNILIGDDIRIKVVSISGDKVKLGITAPNGVEVDREEVRESKIKTGHHSPRKAGA